MRICIISIKFLVVTVITARRQRWNVLKMYSKWPSHNFMLHFNRLISIPNDPITGLAVWFPLFPLSSVWLSVRPSVCAHFEFVLIPFNIQIAWGHPWNVHAPPPSIDIGCVVVVISRPFSPTTGDGVTGSVAQTRRVLATLTSRTELGSD